MLQYRALATRSRPPPARPSPRLGLRLGPGDRAAARAGSRRGRVRLPRGHSGADRRAAGAVPRDRGSPQPRSGRAAVRGRQLRHGALVRRARARPGSRRRAWTRSAASSGRAGTFFVTNLPNRYSYTERIARLLGLYYHGRLPNDQVYTRRTATDLLERHGFRIVELRRVHMLPLTLGGPARPIWTRELGARARSRPQHGGDEPRAGRCLPARSAPAVKDIGRETTARRARTGRSSRSSTSPRVRSASRISTSTNRGQCREQVQASEGLRLVSLDVQHEQIDFPRTRLVEDGAERSRGNLGAS